MSGNKTQQTEVAVQEFISRVEHATRRADSILLDKMFRKITGWQPKMCGPTIVGYGSYHYIYDSGREGDFCATGFSPRKASLSVYIMPGYQDFGEILYRLGKHKMGKACLYINKLADVDLAVLEELIRAGLKDLDAKWSVFPT